MSRVPIVPPMKCSTIEYKAHELVKRHYPDALQGKRPVPVDHFFEIVVPDLVGVNTSYTKLTELGVTNAEGYTNASLRISIVDQELADDFSQRGRRRFRATTGHETGHCVLHVPLARWQASRLLIGQGMKRERAFLKSFEDPEWQAWRFCHGFCMPAKLVFAIADRFKRREDITSALMDTCDVNFSFAEVRLRMLKIIPASTGYTDGKKFARNPKCSGKLAKPWRETTQNFIL